MPSICVIGARQKALEYVEHYISIKNLPQYNIEHFVDAKVDQVRTVKKKLSYKSYNQRIFIFSGEITIEAQNALLKSVEEHTSSTHFIFLAEKEEMLLPTILSRCSVIKLGGKDPIDEEIESLVSCLYKKSGLDWEALEQLTTSISEKGLDVLLPVMRKFLIENIDHNRLAMRSYLSCRKMLSLLPLVEKNNVSIRTLIEKVFIF